MQYELFYLVGSSKEADLETIKKEVSEIVTSEEGVFEEKQVNEKRKMAYKVQHETHGTYVAQRFNLEDPEKLQEINKKLNLYNKVLRFMVSKTSDLPEMLSREEREALKSKVAEARPMEKKAEPKREELHKPEEKRETNPTEDDIDKKLEEILNI